MLLIHFLMDIIRILYTKVLMWNKYFNDLLGYILTKDVAKLINMKYLQILMSFFCYKYIKIFKYILD